MSRLPSVVRTVLACIALSVVGDASAQIVVGVTGTGALQISPSGPSACPGTGHFFSGQSVRIAGSGFNSSASVDVYYRIEGGNEMLIDTVSADGAGALDAVVTLPTEPSTPVMASLSARGPSAPGEVLSLSALFDLLGAPGTDSDSDSVPDVCDNCPMDANAGQEDDDLDGLGNVCDTPCPLDPENDADGDGLCADVDPCPSDPDNDVDGDGICADVDNCPMDSNPGQLDQDLNGIGDVCQTDATCSDGMDNDGDGLVDHPADPGCSDAMDTAETDPGLPCDDGLDNDADGLIDFVSGGLGDPGCLDGTSPAEDPECDDGIDNDDDGGVDWDGKYGVFPVDPDCAGVGSTATELPEPRPIWGFLLGAAVLGGLKRRGGDRLGGQS